MKTLLFRKCNSPGETAKCKQTSVKNKDCIKMLLNLHFSGAKHSISQKGLSKRKMRRLEDLLIERENILRSH